jgi:hypothetical protein
VNDVRRAAELAGDDSQQRARAHEVGSARAVHRAEGLDDVEKILLAHVQGTLAI